ncbi:PAS domain S-box protein [Nostoc sp. DSM 114160]|jgi:PAS domain S-box-containing protein
MERPQTETVTLEDIVITQELSRRNPRPANLASENQALHTLARQLVNQPETMLQSLVDMALELCNAQSTGVSLLEVLPSGEEVFRWNVLAGALKQYVGGTIPRNFSPCGTCLDRGTPVLYSYPERYFTYFQEAKTPFVEGLVLPLIADNKALGTIWIISHDEQRHFDSEDVRVMTSLANFTAATLLLNHRQTKELLAANAALEAEIVLRKQAQERSRALIENLPGGAAFVVDRELRYLLAEEEALSAAGFKSEDFVGKTIFEVLPLELAATYEVFYRRGLAGESFEHEHDAHNRSFISRGTPLRSVDGEVYAVLAVSYDITERKLAEELLRKSEERQFFLLKLSDALRSLADPVDIQQTVTRTAMNYFGADRCYYCEIEDGNAIIRRDTVRGDLPTVVGVYPLSNFAILQAVVDRGRPFIVRDVHTTDTVDEDVRQLCIQLQVISYVNVPVIKNGKSVGIFCLVQSTPRDWTDMEVELATETADRTWAAVERARAEIGLRQSEEKYRLLFNSIAEGYALCELLYDDDERAIDWKILQVNPAFESLTGLRDVAGKNATQLNQPLNQNWLQTFGTVAQTGESTRFEHYIDSVDYWFEILVSRINEDKHHIVVVFNNITDRKQAEADRIRLIQEQAARQQERQRAEALADLDRAKTAFFSNVSHEFRTPITLLLAPLQDALSDRTHPLPQEQSLRLELAQRNAVRLLKLVNTLLDFSRIEAGRMEAVYEPTDLATFTTELASVFRSAIERASLRLVVDCPPLAEPVYVDRQMWEKIVLNLLSNAFKFTLEGEIAVRLHLADRRHVTLQVEDTGTGIEPEELPHLFERFYQVRSTKARTHEGSGIGLALVQELIEMHGGTIDVSSTVGQGSCFTVTIPLGTAHLPSVSVSEAVATLGASAGRNSARRLRFDVGESPSETLRDRIIATRTLTSTALGAAPYVQEAERWLLQDSDTTEVGEAAAKTISANPEIISANPEIISANPEIISANPEIISANPEIISANSEIISANPEIISANSETKTSSPPPSTYVLIVDDNADMRDYLKRILSDRDVEVEAVADGAAAQAAITERVPSLVLSDVMMPQVDGFELLKALRADARTKEVPIILLSARAREESVIEGLQAGADDYLIKPFSATELVTRVLAHLQMAQLRSLALHQEKTINRMKDKFLAEVSHELNTPLVAILGWTRLLRSSQPSLAMLTKSLEAIERNATLQTKLVQDLLDISRITAGKINLNPEPVELQEVIETAIATVHQSYQTKDIHLKCTLAPLPVTVQGDPHRLQQIVLNLLTNAVKFTPTGGKIEISLQTHENQAQIILSDTGCGIDSEFLPHIFDAFRQAKGTKKGLGLGLAIARNLVELHGGTIYAQSAAVGQGATFIVNLPLSGNSI